MTSPGAHGGSETIRLSVPAEADMVQVVRVAVRVVAGRAGCSDDARSRLQAAAGAAFFELLERNDSASVVDVSLITEASRMIVEMGTADAVTPLLDGQALAGLADGHELLRGGQALRIWVSC